MTFNCDTLHGLALGSADTCTPIEFGYIILRIKEMQTLDQSLMKRLLARKA